MKTRTIILTPPSHASCQISPGPWKLQDNAIVASSKGPVCLSLRYHESPNGDPPISSDERDGNARYISECMGEVPAWELAVKIVFGEFPYAGEKIVIHPADEVTDEMWEAFTGHGRMFKPSTLQRKALAWLLRSGCAKGVVS